jgi:hypothetical protein
MSDIPEWKGGRIGPHHVGRRYHGIPSDEGHIYEAHNIETGASAIEEREDARAHFTRRALPPGRRQRVMKWGFVGIGVALATGLALILWPHARKDTERRHASAGVAQAARDESIAFTDTQDTSLPSVIGYPMPEAPFKEQKRPPCIPVTETEIRGGCWTQHKLDAPCPRSTAEYQGKCFMPVKKPDPQPRSIQP